MDKSKELETAGRELKRARLALSEASVAHRETRDRVLKADGDVNVAQARFDAALREWEQTL